MTPSYGAMPLEVLKKLLDGVELFHFVGVDSAKDGEYALFFVNGVDRHSEIPAAIEKHFGPRFVRKDDTYGTVDKEAMLTFLPQGDRTMVEFHICGRTWASTEFALLREIDNALKPLKLTLLPKLPNSDESFFRGQIIPHTYKPHIPQK